MTRSFNRQVWAGRAAWIWALLLLVACLLPSEEVPQVKVPFADKWVHFLLFGSQTFLALAALKRPTRGHIAAITLLCALLGVGIELLQLATHRWLHRAYETMDIVADVVGVLLGLCLFLIFRKYFFKPASNR